MTATTSPAPVERVFFTQNELIARWGVCAQTLKKLRKAGRLRSVKFGVQKHRYPVAAVLEFEKGEAEPGTATAAA